MKFKKIVCLIVVMVFAVTFVGCGSTEKAIELMGAGERIHDSYTFANVGTKIKDDGKNTYTIYGSVDALNSAAVTEEFEIAADVSHIVAVKLSAMGESVQKDKVEIMVNGVRNYDAEHLNGSHYTYILLEAKPGTTVSISVKWSEAGSENNYFVYFDNSLELK